MLTEIQVNKTERKVYALNEEYKPFFEAPCGVSFYAGYNEYGQPYSNADDGVYRDGQVWVEAKGPDGADEPGYGWAYINIDERGRALHGGGANLGEPGCYAPFQPLLPTLGCFRLHNADVYYLALLFLEAESKGFRPCIHVVS